MIRGSQRKEKEERPVPVKPETGGSVAGTQVPVPA